MHKNLLGSYSLYKKLFITNADTKRDIVSLSKHLLTRLICDNLDMQEETNSVIWQSYDMLVSLINPRSLAEGTGLIVSPRKFRHISVARFCKFR